MPGPAVTATSFKTLVIRNNTVVNRDKPAVPERMRGSIRAELGTGLWVEGNEWTTAGSSEAPGLFYDADTAHSIACRDNKVKTS